MKRTNRGTQILCSSDARIVKRNFLGSVEPLVALFAAGLGIETLLAMNVTGHALWAGGIVTVTSLIYMAWFWLTVVLGISVLSGMLRNRIGTAYWIAAVGVVAVVAALLFGLIVSVYRPWEWVSVCSQDFGPSAMRACHLGSP